jgi:uncharacterized protein (DUF111 family)
MMQLVLSCPSGIAGNLWMAAMLGLGADAALLEDLPARLGVPRAWVDWRFDPRSQLSQVEVRGTEGTPETDYRGLVGMVEAAGLADGVRKQALRVLGRRERAEARFLGEDLHRRRLKDEDVADTLLDVVGGILLWHSLGRPVTLTNGPVFIGARPRGSSLCLLQGIPVARGGTDLCLATPTGAALLSDCWQGGAVRGVAARSVQVPGDFSREADLDPLHAALYTDLSPGWGPRPRGRAGAARP